jgi:hypothetical protein
MYRTAVTLIEMLSRVNDVLRRDVHRHDAERDSLHLHKQRRQVDQPRSLRAPGAAQEKVDRPLVLAQDAQAAEQVQEDAEDGGEHDVHGSPQAGTASMITAARG